MRFVDNLAHDEPALNLALEEYILRHANLDEDIFLFYINRPSIIIGKHQNTVEEINTDYVEKNDIRIVRRLSGGGAVYHDHGNLNFSFITTYQPGKLQNFKEFTFPVVQALNRLGVNAEVNGRNDILVNGFKVSGNAQYITQGRMYSHGTLLFNSDLSQVAEALRVKPDKILSKGIKSVRSRVANIHEFISNEMSIEEFRRYLLDNIFEGLTAVPEIPVTAADWAAVEKLADTRYRSWEWNYGMSPAFNVQKTHRFPGGEIDMRIQVEKGMIQGAHFFGDFFSLDEPGEIESRLVGIPYTNRALASFFETVDLERYFIGTPREEFMDFLSQPASSITTTS